MRVQRLEGRAPDLEDALSVSARPSGPALDNSCSRRTRNPIFAHALFRRTLSEMDNSVAPDAWTFDSEPHGKPVLAHHGTRGRIAFNLTHTRGVVACACASSGSVGIDLEAIDRHADYMELATAYLAPAKTRICAAQRTPVAAHGSSSCGRSKKRMSKPSAADWASICRRLRSRAMMPGCCTSHHRSAIQGAGRSRCSPSTPATGWLLPPRLAAAVLR